MYSFFFPLVALYVFFASLLGEHVARIFLCVSGVHVFLEGKRGKQNTAFALIV